MSFMIFFTSCDGVFTNQTFPEVDFNVAKEVQVTYRQNIYNLKIYYSSGTVTISYVDDNSALDGVCYTVNSEICRVSYADLVYDIPVEKLATNYFPLVVYKFITDFGGVIPTESYNSQSSCSYISRNVFCNTVTLEVYEYENNIAHSLHIT